MTKRATLFAILFLCAAGAPPIATAQNADASLDLSGEIAALAECVAFYNASADYESEMMDDDAVAAYQSKAATFMQAAADKAFEVPAITDKGKHIGDIIGAKQTGFSDQLFENSPESLKAISAQEQACVSLGDYMQARE